MQRYKLKKELMGNIQNQLPKIPNNAKTIIIVLGQCLLPDGKPHQWLYDRVNTAYQLLISQKLDISTTYFIVSGSDVSNQQYGIIQTKLKHKTEAWWMHKLLHEIDQKKNQTKLSKEVFSQHIIIQERARTTIQNFYYSFKMINRSDLEGKIKDIYVVTSDFHLKRAKFCFDTMFFRQQLQIIDDYKTFVYKDQVHFIESKSNWQNDNDRKKKFQKQERLYNESWLILQTKNTAQRLWEQCNSLKKMQNKNDN